MIDIKNIDCMEYMATCKDKQFHLAIVDPPYGINAPNMQMGQNLSRKNGWHQTESTAVKLKKGRLNSGGGHFKGRNLTTMNCNWDSQKPTKEYWDELRRVSMDQIVWGGNYFTSNLPESRCWVCWDKIQPWDNFSQFELAWTSFDKPAALISLSNRGGANDENKIHPTQKPIRLYKYLLKKFALEGMNILDTHGGSMSSAIAFHDFKCEAVICEIDKIYFDSGKKRFEQHQRQTQLF